ncbi:MAG: fatty acid desaturase [Gammaproteobacteria bacterium]
MRIYLRYFGTHLLVAATIIGLLLGGSWSWLGLLTGVVGWIGADALSTTVAAPPVYRHPRLLDMALYSLLVPLVVLCVVYAWTLAHGDLCALGRTLTTLSGYPLLDARATNTTLDRLGASWSFALAIAMAAILTAHELLHRQRDRLALVAGRLMLAMACNATLEVAHVFGHHREVGTPADPATARRGESVYHFWVRSSCGQVLQAWRIERARLTGQPWPRRWLRNRALRGLVRSGTVIVLFHAAGGATAVVWFLLATAWNKLLLEALNYMEHYGLVRVPGTPIEARHAWDADSAFSHAALFNLPWHADHHHRSGVPFGRLRASPTAPHLGRGYLATLPLVLVPPLWQRLIAPRLADWDRRLASAAERALVADTPAHRRGDLSAT